VRTARARPDVDLILDFGDDDTGRCRHDPDREDLPGFERLARKITPGPQDGVSRRVVRTFDTPGPRSAPRRSAALHQ